jgi:hypothetical protein
MSKTPLILRTCIIFIHAALQGYECDAPWNLRAVTLSASCCQGRQSLSGEGCCAMGTTVSPGTLVGVPAQLDRVHQPVLPRLVAACIWWNLGRPPTS